MKLIKEEILCAGFGGQGIMLMGRLLAYAGMNMGYEVSWIPSYGAEVRGGTACSMIRIQTEKIADPVIDRPTICIVMNMPSLLKFSTRVKPKGLLLIDSTEITAIPKIKNVNVKKAPFTKIAANVLGDRRVANMVAIGAFNKIRSLFPIEELIRPLSSLFQDKHELIPINEKALREGYNVELE